jgi:DNA-binding XRE family transcriptional regulator
MKREPALMSRQDQKQRVAWSRQLREFRHQHLYTQIALADVLGCCRRTIVSIETGATLNPHYGLLRRFLALKAKERAA